MRRWSAALMCAVLLTMSGCQAEPVSSTIFAMDTVMELTVYGERETLDGAVELIHDLETRLSVTDVQSEIFAVNGAGSGEVSGDTAALLGRALELCELTGGALDVTVYPVVHAWGFTTGEYRVPDENETARLLESVDYRAVVLEGENVTLPHGAQLDLGAVAKGWTGDRLAELMEDAGVKSALFSLGGNIQAVGSKPDGRPWRVGIRDPFGQGMIGAFDVSDAAVVTSGGYQRYFEEDGKRYCHIIDPRTGRPADSGLASVTVTGPEGVLCDGLSTAIYVMGLDGACALWREYGGFELVLVTDAGEVYITEGLEGVLVLMGDYENKEIKVIRRG